MRRAVSVAIALAAFAFRGASAQCGTDPNSRFNKVDALPIALLFPNPTPLEFANGYTTIRTYAVEVHPIAQDRLRPWFLCFSAEAPLWPTQTGSPKPASDLEWSIDGLLWAQVTQTPQSIGPTYTGRQTVQVRVRARLDYDDLPGTYGPLPLRFWAAH